MDSIQVLCSPDKGNSVGNWYICIPNLKILVCFQRVLYIIFDLVYKNLVDFCHRISLSL